MPQWSEVAVRSLLAVVSLFLLTRMLGKRQVTQLSLFEYITGITIGSLAASISLDMNSDWYLGIVALVVWIAFSLVIEYARLKSRRLRAWVEGKPTVLIEDGKVLEHNMYKERLASDDLLEQLRKKNVFQTADVEFAVIEPSGEINVLLKRDRRPATLELLGRRAKRDEAAQTVIMDGVLLEEPLAACGTNRASLEAKLDKLGVSVEEVYLGQIDSEGQLYIDLYDDKRKS